MSIKCTGFADAVAVVVVVALRIVINIQQPVSVSECVSESVSQSNSQSQWQFCYWKEKWQFSETIAILTLFSGVNERTFWIRRKTNEWLIAVVVRSKCCQFCVQWNESRIQSMTHWHNQLEIILLYWYTHAIVNRGKCISQNLSIFLQWLRYDVSNPKVLSTLNVPYPIAAQC